MAYAIATKGWIAATINADELQFYESGLIASTDSPKQPNHAIVLVGHGSEDGFKYWIGRNNWGENWGDKGYFKIERGTNAGDIANPLEGFRGYLA
jgi:C1A family cysteine protease